MRSGNLEFETMMLSEEQKTAVIANLPLAKHVVASSCKRPTQDDYQDAVIGLCLAVLRFDVFYGARFSSFAVPTIQGTMHTRRRKGQLIRVPREAYKSTSETIRKRANNAHVWLVGRLDDVPVDHDWPDLDMADQLTDLLESLPKREQVVVRMRHAEEKTLEQIAKILRVSKERVRQIDMRAIDKLKAEAKRRGIEYPCPAGSSRKKTIQLA